MQKEKSKTEIRHEKIRGMLIANDLVTVAEFCQALDCSEATIRNDLRYLEELGLLKRSFGGAVANGKTALYSNMNMRSVAYRKEKESIAAYIVKHILSSGQTIILDSGSTAVEIAKKILESSLELTVLTNSFAAASLLTNSDKIKLYMASGCYDERSASFHDELSQALFETMRADICFLGVNGVSHEAGFTISGHEEASIKQAMIRCSQKCIVPADTSKLGKIGLKIICSLTDVDTLICDTDNGDGELDLLKSAGLNVVFADHG